MKVCISCELDVEGKRAVPVREDRIIKGFRAVKKVFGIAKMNELYVCEADMQKHSERRRTFERSMLFASVLAGILIVLVLGMLLLSGRFDIWAVFSAFIIGAFILALPLFRYTPALQVNTVSSPQIKPSAVKFIPPSVKVQAKSSSKKLKRKTR